MKIKYQEKFIDEQLDKISSLIELNMLYETTKATISKLFKLKQNGHNVKDELDKWSRLKRRIELISPLFIEQAIELQSQPTTDKQKYRYLCSFQITPNTLKNIKGYSLLQELGFYNRNDNPGGVVKDHRFSVNSGYKLRVCPELMSNLNNCEFLTNIENIRKSDSCSISLKELKSFMP